MQRVHYNFSLFWDSHWKTPLEKISKWFWPHCIELLHYCLNARRHAKSLLLCPTLGDPMDCRLQGSSVRGILQARILEWVAMPSSRGASDPGIELTPTTEPPRKPQESPVLCLNEPAACIQFPWPPTSGQSPCLDKISPSFWLPFGCFLVRLYCFVLFCFLKIYYLFDCTGSKLWHVGSSSLTRDWTWAPCIGSTEFQSLDLLGSPQVSLWNP